MLFLWCFPCWCLRLWLSEIAGSFDSLSLSLSLCLSLSLSCTASVTIPLWSPAKSGAVICTPALRFTLSRHSPPSLFCTWRLGNPLHFHHCCKQFDTGSIAQVHLPQSTKCAAFLTGPCCHRFICNNFSFVTRTAGPDPGSSLTTQMASWDKDYTLSRAHVCTLVLSLAHTPQNHGESSKIERPMLTVFTALQSWVVKACHQEECSVDIKERENTHNKSPEWFLSAT